MHAVNVVLTSKLHNLSFGVSSKYHLFKQSYIVITTGSEKDEWMDFI